MSNLSSLYKSIEKIMWTDTGLNGDAQRIEQFAWMLFFKIFSDKDKELDVMDDAYQSPIPEAYRWDTWAGNDEGMTGDELLAFVDRDLFPALRNLDISAGTNRRALIVREVFEGNNNYMKSGGNLRKVLNKLNEIDFNRAKDRHAFGDIYESILKGLQSAGKSGEYYTPRAVTQFICDTLAPKLGETVLDPACGTGGFLTAAVETLKGQAKSVADQQELQKVKGWEYKPLPFLLATTNLILHDVEVPNITYRDVLDQPLSSYSQKDRVDVVLANPPFGGIVANNNETNFPATFRTKESADLFLVLIMHLLKDGGRAGMVLPDSSLTGKDVKQRVRQKLLEGCNLHTIVRLPNSVFQPYASVATNLLFFTKGTPTKEIWYYQHLLPEGQKSYSKMKAIRREEFQPIEAWWNNREESEVAWRVPIQTIIDRGYDLDIKNPHQEVEKSINPETALYELEDSEDKIQCLVNDLESAIKSTAPEKHFFVENLNKIALAPNGIKAIKQAILGLAMQGRLLPQEPSDEPAAVLLQKLKAAKAPVNKVSNRVARPLLREGAKTVKGPFEMPEGWVGCELGEVTLIEGGVTLGKTHKKETTAYPYLRVANVQRGFLDLTEMKKLSVTESEYRKTQLEPNDLLVVEGNGSFKEIGRCAIWHGEIENCIHQNHIIRVRPSEGITPKMIMYFLNSSFGITQMKELAITTTGLYTLSISKIKRIVIPLPPLAEQYRIVTKVEELLHQCDALEQHILESGRLAEQLLQTALREALAPPAGAASTAIDPAVSEVSIATPQRPTKSDKKAAHTGDLFA